MRASTSSLCCVGAMTTAHATNTISAAARGEFPQTMMLPPLSPLPAGLRRSCIPATEGSGTDQSYDLISDVQPYDVDALDVRMITRARAHPELCKLCHDMSER